MIKIGDRVKFINDTSVGYVSKITKDIVEVDVEDGFTVPCLITEIVVVNAEDEVAAIKSIGVGDERPGAKKKKNKQKDDSNKKSTREPAYAKYGKVSFIDNFSSNSDDDDMTDDDDDDDFDDSYLDLDRMHDIYVRNKVAAEQKERDLEAAKLKAEEDKKRVIEQSTVTSLNNVAENTTNEVETKDNKMQVVSQDQLATKLNVNIPKPIINNKPDKKTPGIEVIDLHAGEIIDTTAGMSSSEILNVQMARFTLWLDLAIKSGKHGKVIFIHGVGSGKLKYEMQKVLSSKYPKLGVQDASFREYGYGAMLIIY